MISAGNISGAHLCILRVNQSTLITEELGTYIKSYRNRLVYTYHNQGYLYSYQPELYKISWPCKSH